MTVRSIPSEFGHLADVDMDTVAPVDGDVPVWDTDKWVPGASGTGGTPTDGEDITVDNTGGFVVTASSVWGLDANGRAYHDPAGAVSGEDATFVAADRPYLST